MPAPPEHPRPSRGRPPKLTRESIVEAGVAIGLPNVQITTVADRLGHVTASFTLAVYGHSNADRDRAAAAAIGSVLGG